MNATGLANSRVDEAGVHADCKGVAGVLKSCKGGVIVYERGEPALFELEAECA